MEIREYKTYNEPEILRLYTSVGWTAYTDHPDVLRKGFENSMLTLAASGYHSCRWRWVYHSVCSGHFSVSRASTQRHRLRAPASYLGQIQPCSSD